jgi:hypothetical protein
MIYGNHSNERTIPRNDRVIPRNEGTVSINDWAISTNDRVASANGPIIPEAARPFLEITLPLREMAR